MGMQRLWQPFGKQGFRGRAPAYMDTLKRDAQNEVVQLSNQILERTQMIDETRQRYDRDKERWRLLRGAAAR